MSEFKTAREAEDMVRSLHRAARYCTGENSARRHGERVKQVEAEAARLRTEENAQQKNGRRP